MVSFVCQVERGKAVLEIVLFVWSVVLFVLLGSCPCDGKREHAVLFHRKGRYVDHLWRWLHPLLDARFSFHNNSQLCFRGRIERNYNAAT